MRLPPCDVSEAQFCSYTFNSISISWKKWEKAHFFPNINFFKAIFSMGEKVMFKTEDQF